MKLSRILEHHLLEGVKITGSYDPQDVLSYIQEDLTPTEYDAVEEFLTWVDDRRKTFGHGNIQELWEEWQGD